MSQNCILRTRAQIDGAIREPGYRFVLPDGVLGPHRAGRAAPERINNASGLYERLDEDRGEDVRLYDVIGDSPPEKVLLEDKLAAKRAELDDLDAKRQSLLKEIDAIAAEQNKAEAVSESRNAGHAPPFNVPEPPVVKTVPPLVGQKPPVASPAPPPALGKPGEPRPGVGPIAPDPAPAPSKPVMSQPADAPAEKGKTERMDGSF